MQLSSEQIASLDADALVLFDGGDAEALRTLQQNPLYERLPVVQRGAVVTYDYDEFIGLRNPSPLSIPWIVDRIAPGLSEAVGRPGFSGVPRPPLRPAPASPVPAAVVCGGLIPGGGASVERAEEARRVTPGRSNANTRRDQSNE